MISTVYCLDCIDQDFLNFSNDVPPRVTKFNIHLPTNELIKYIEWQNITNLQVPEFDKHLKKAGGHIDRNVVEITIKMKTRPKTLKDKNNLSVFNIV